MSKDYDTRGKPDHNVLQAAKHFSSRVEITGIHELGRGNVNDTFLVSPSKSSPRFVLQRINTHVFCRPDLVMQNIRTFTEHAVKRLSQVSLLDRRWVVPRIISTEDGRDYWIDTSDSFWRAISFIENSDSFDTIKDTGHASEVGYALGLFHNLISDLPTGRLADTLEGFHITPLYLRRFDSIISKKQSAVSLPLAQCFRFIEARRVGVPLLEDAKRRGLLGLRPIHGDPKVNNVLIDLTSGKAVSLIDLDTVKPGLVLYDLGDCLRSSCNPLGEDIARLDQIRFEPDICQAVFRGYFSVPANSLTECDYNFIYDAIRLITFELGLRFCTDYLEGDVYFKVRHPEQNLERAIVQFRLVESIEMQQGIIRKIVKDLR